MASIELSFICNHATTGLNAELAVLSLEETLKNSFEANFMALIRKKYRYLSISTTQI